MLQIHIFYCLFHDAKKKYVNFKHLALNQMFVHVAAAIRGAHCLIAM